MPKVSIQYTAKNYVLVKLNECISFDGIRGIGVNPTLRCALGRILSRIACDEIKIIVTDAARKTQFFFSGR